MGDRRRTPSAASRVFLVLLAAVVVVAAIVAALLVLEAQRAARAEAERVTRAVAETIAATDAVGEALPAADASDRLQPFAEKVMAEAGMDFITLMTTDGIRVTHRDPHEIGRHYALAGVAILLRELADRVVVRRGHRGGAGESKVGRRHHR